MFVKGAKLRSDAHVDDCAESTVSKTRVFETDMDRGHLLLTQYRLSGGMDAAHIILEDVSLFFSSLLQGSATFTQRADEARSRARVSSAKG